jgi:hypothetical protein
MRITDRCHQHVESIKPLKILACLKYTVKVDELLTKPGVEVDISTLRLISVERVGLLQCGLRRSQPIHRRVRRNRRKRRPPLCGIVQSACVCHGLARGRRVSFFYRYALTCAVGLLVSLVAERV